MSEAWSIMVHGGAGASAEKEPAANRAGCLAALAAGQAVLEAGGAAIDAVVAAIRVLEEDATFNAGYGAVLNAEGEVELDAGIMDGATLDVGAVAALRGVRDPIDVAHRLLHDKTVLLVGEGAYRFAQRVGAMLCEPADLIAPHRRRKGCDTVGCVAMDQSGNFAAGTSTGGLDNVPPGRVGDSPIPGAGYYAENARGAVSFSGDGESILRLALAARLIDALEEDDPGAASAQAIARLAAIGGEGGCIVLGPRGTPAFAHNSPGFAVALATSTRRAAAFLHSEEFSR